VLEIKRGGCKMYFKYFKDAKEYAEKYFTKYHIGYCQEHKMLYVWGARK
jgi:hypothetical protein